uniref:Uncharacterized protein n=2 Tax=Gloeothece TaxID=28070 RepID=E0UCN3_GLOV7|nr:conserved hypothetical protein [Gloeothece verrucosa PCC 7822]ADN15227.1 conserved hypothetical protein [Gloeothece verrucosa PCC 7822]ADN16425.1 conserved hypothetical protein [Gloeothece verrucosa PCC 7822]
MQIKTISYKRIVNLGNYNSEHLEMYGELEPGEDPIAEAKNLKEIVSSALELIKPPPQSPATKEVQPVTRQPSDQNDPPF